MKARFRVISSGILQGFAQKYSIRQYSALAARSKLIPLLSETKVFTAFHSSRGFAKDVRVINVPTLGDSISEGTLATWKKNVGDYVDIDGVLAIVETDKVTVDVNSPAAGVIMKQYSNEGDTIFVGKPFIDLDVSAEKPAKTEAKSVEAPKVAEPTPAPEKTLSKPVQTPPSPPSPPKVVVSEGALETRVPMSRMRMRIAERLKHAQTENVMLSTFNECDMSKIMDLRKELNESGEVSCKLGFVSAFMRASTLSLLKMPIMNSYIEGKEIVTKNYVDISVAVATPTGLLVPVIRNCEGKTWEQLELALVNVAKKARENGLTVEDMTGGTFTISNGGVYGSLLSTPIINPPQSCILGMHAITKRCVVKNDEIVIRPMMNLALTYDHRLIDGRDAVTFLNSIKKYIENPSLMLIK
ncbi:dihydrolipoamide acetyltransferase component of pyruvate dehydrogenase, putative [Theileria equi strain WA]|uniref:Dihydrolipoamide acetyltransferase component of pyruvate dehydrogenase complex n=1 Tax=Theileria equi strain WA TaxID=1537102 RepID=L0AYL9_THEEQ|nr:dihydrolipoamide acetyltransferase component of pyruvate dehydrogenase, putative [Theileria equi strain WA]AFZ80343.1 dihydrolipoamide acetyltransferase component of pyruvate dehydrogenase, putative [Theileria equi strain WA]|eukprot:XP_004830009.1 dihydrolipoamide acetyltransferase component of pyruvate dehydrogenase, putative [Theileria equi strain WA]